MPYKQQKKIAQEVVRKLGRSRREQGGGIMKRLLLFVAVFILAASVSFAEEAGEIAKVLAARTSAAVVFESDMSGNWDLWVMNEDGSELQQLTKSLENDIYPTISRNGKKLLWFSGDKPVLLDVDSATITEPKIEGLSPEIGDPPYVLSPDGAMVAFISVGGLEIADLHTGSSHWMRAIDGVGDADVRSFHWSYDSKQLIAAIHMEDPAVTSGLADMYRLWVVDVISGKPVRQLAFEGMRSGDDEAPSWSFDGSRIVFIRYEPPSSGANYIPTIRVINTSDGRLVSRFQWNTTYGAPYRLDWSRDGGSFFVATIKNRLSQIYKVDADIGTVTKVLTPVGGKSWSPSTFEPRFAITPVFLKEDVDKSGTVDILDLVFVARDFGGIAYDLDGSGTTDITDLILVALKFGEGTVSAAPSRALLEERNKLVEQLQKARSPEDIRNILNDFVPAVPRPGMKLTTWGQMKKP